MDLHKQFRKGKVHLGVPSEIFWHIFHICTALCAHGHINVMDNISPIFSNKPNNLFLDFKFVLKNVNCEQNQADISQKIKFLCAVACAIIR